MQEVCRGDLIRGTGDSRAGVEISAVPTPNPPSPGARKQVPRRLPPRLEIAPVSQSGFRGQTERKTREEGYRRKNRVDLDFGLTFCFLSPKFLLEEKESKKETRTKFFKRDKKQTSCSFSMTPETPNSAILNNEKHSV